MSDTVQVPFKRLGQNRWGRLNVLAQSHILVAERFQLKEDNFSLFGQHRVRKYKLHGNVHWLIPEEVLDISQVNASQVPRRQK